MDTITAILGIGFIALFVIPLLLISNAGKNKKKKLISQLYIFAEENTGSISKYDHWKNSCIGIDSINKRVYHVTKDNDGFKKTEIYLNDVSKCLFTGTNQSNISQTNNKIGLNFSFKNPQTKVTKIDFFDTKEKWQLIISSELK